MGSQTARATSQPDAWLFRPSAVSSSSIDIIVFKAKVVPSRGSNLVDRGWSERHGPCSEFSCKRGSTLFPFHRDGLCGKIGEWLRQAILVAGQPGRQADDSRLAGIRRTGSWLDRRPGCQAARQPSGQAATRLGRGGQADEWLRGWAARRLGSLAVGWLGGRLHGVIELTCG